MGIANFPPALQPIIQQGFLEREFEQALRSRLGYRAVADRELIPIRIGETITKSRAGLMPAVTTPLNPATNTNIDNGLTTGSWGVEQYTLTMNSYAATMDLNVVESQVGIASLFLQNAYADGEQGARSLDELARNALFNAYFSGNTWVTTGLTEPSTTVSVDDIRGFQYVWDANNQMQTVSTANPLSVQINNNNGVVIAAVPSGTATSDAPGGIAGTLTFASAVSATNGAVGNSVVAINASLILRPSGRTNTTLLQAGDTLTMSNLLDAVAALRANAVPEIDGVYNCYLDPVSARQLFADPDFRQLFTGATSSNEVFRQAMVNDFLGLRFIPTTQAYVQEHPTLANVLIRRPIVCGKGALIEGDFDGMAKPDYAPPDTLVSIVDDVAMVTREPLDRLQQIIAQSWYWIGGFCVPTDTTTTPATIPTASAAVYKRAVMIEHIG